MAKSELKPAMLHSKSDLVSHPALYGIVLVGFYGWSTLVSYLMPNPLYTYILNIYGLVWFDFMTY